MRTFPHFNPACESTCPVCGTAEDKETVLIPILGSEEGNLCRAEQFHVQCIEANWRYYEGGNVLFCIALARAKVPPSFAWPKEPA